MRQAIVERRVRSGDAELLTRSAGGRDGGETLIVLHGGPGLSHDYTARLLCLASPELRVVVYDQRGAGRSTGSIGPGALLRQLDDLAAVRRAYGARRSHLLGHGAGALLIMQQADVDRDAIASATFVDGVPPTRAGLDSFLASLGARTAGVHGLDPAPAAFAGTGWWRSARPACFYDASHPLARADDGTTCRGDVFAALVDELGDYDFRPALAGLYAPALVVTCAWPLPPGLARTVAGAIPGARTIRLERCGHLPWLESPRRFFPAIETFLCEAAVTRVSI